MDGAKQRDSANQTSWRNGLSGIAKDLRPREGGRGEEVRGEAANIPNAQFGFIVLIKYKGSSS